jgi:cytochrome c oxidase subunit II
MPPLRPFVLAALCALAAAGCGSDSGDSASAPGEDAYRQYACASCHSLDGDDGTGPTFKGLAGSTVTLDDGSRVKATRAYLRRSILEPDAQVVEGYAAGLMAASIDGFDLESRPEDVERLIAFIEGVK